MKPVEYEQTDPRWRDVPYTVTGNSKETIGTDGCGPTCAAMVVATLRNKDVTPIQAAKWAREHGYLSPYDGTYWAFFRPYLAWYGIDCKETDSKDEAIQALKKGRMVITAMGKGIFTSIGHFILAYGISSSGKVLINDPNSEASYREQANLSNYRNESKEFWIIPEVWNVQLKEIQIKDLDRGKMIPVSGFTIDGTNYMRVRDAEKLAPVVISNEGSVPTIRANFKK